MNGMGQTRKISEGVWTLAWQEQRMWATDTGKEARVRKDFPFQMPMAIRITLALYGVYKSPNVQVHSRWLMWLEMKQKLKLVQKSFLVVKQPRSKVVI